MKIWSKLFLVTATGMMMFSSCLKNIEPEGLADLRGAKAELLRAQTAVEAANAAKIEADAALVLAQAKVQEAMAKQEEAKAAYQAAVARLKELEVEKQTTLNQIEIEQAIAAAKAEIAKSEAEVARVAAEAEEHLLGVLTRVAEAQAKYESALKDLALAAASLTGKQAGKLETLENAVTTAREDVEAKTAALESAAVELAYALAQVDDEAAQKTAVRIAEFALVKAQAAVEGAVEAEAVAKAALELDPSVTDWEAKADEYLAEIEKLDAEYWKRYGEIQDAMSAMEDSIKVEGSTPKGVIAVKAADYTKFTGYSFNDVTGLFSQLAGSPTENIKIEGEYAVAAPKNADGDPIDGVEDFNLTDTEYTYGEEAEVVKKFEDALKDLAKVNVASYEAQIAVEEALVEASKNNPEYKYKVERYNDAVAAYNAGDVVPYFTEYVFDEDYDLAAAVKEYNDAVAVLDAAVKKYHDELDKYTTDSKEKDAADTALEKALAEAANALKAAYQKAYDDNKVAAKIAQKNDAERVKNNAQTSYNTVETSAKTATGAATVDDIKDFVKNYDAATADDAAKAKYPVWSAWNAKIVAAESTLTNANKAYNDADKAATDANDDYTAAKATADEAHEKAVATANEAYDKAMAAIAEKATGFDPEYRDNLEKQIEDAVDKLKDGTTGKIAAVKTYASYFTENTTEQTVNILVEDGTPASYSITGVPAFMVEGTYDGSSTTYALKVVAVADFVDKEYFKDNVVADLANDLTRIGIDYAIDYRDEYYNPSTHYFSYQNLNCNTYPGYPLELPTSEEYADFMEDMTGHLYDIPQNVLAYGLALINNNPTYFVYDAVVKAYPSFPSLYAEVAAEAKIADLKAAIEALGQLPDFVKAIEAAQAKFEAFVAEKAAEYAAYKAEVEAFYARYLPLDEKNDAELEAIDAKYAVIKARYNAMVQVIKDYCKAQNGGTAVELAAFVENLKSQCTDAVAALKSAEEAVYTAEKDLEKAKNGLVSAAELAQRAYDQAATDLAIALAKLEGATIALENAIAVIYGVEPVVPETPDTPDTPEGGDDTTDEGGEAEGGEGEGEGEAEGGEGEGGEETPAE